MTTQEKDRIECAIRHIQTAVDVDPWAIEIAVEAMKKEISALQAQDSPKPKAESVQNVQNEDLISRKAAIEAMSESLKRVFPEHRQIAEKCLKALPPAQPEPSIPISWIEKQIDWLKSMDNEFANITAMNISVFVKKWRKENRKTEGKENR